MREILDPMRDFYIIIGKKEKSIFYLFPMIIGIFAFLLFKFIHGNEMFNIVNFTNDFVNQLITMLTLFVSFTMAYLSIIVASNSDSIAELKRTDSKEYYLKEKGDCTLYQILISEITYNLLIEIIFLLIVIMEKFIVCIFNNIVLKILLAIDISIFIHVIVVMVIIVKNIYYSFWKSK